MPRTLKEVRKLFGKQGFTSLRQSWQRQSENYHHRHVSWVHARINHRVNLKRTLQQQGRSGRILVWTQSVDCDMAQRTTQEIVPTYKSVMEMWLIVENFYSGLEGYGNIVFSEPSEGDVSFSQSRDLALEAFEDGHPHVVYR